MERIMERIIKTQKTQNSTIDLNLNLIQLYEKLNEVQEINSKIIKNIEINNKDIGFIK